MTRWTLTLIALTTTLSANAQTMRVEPTIPEGTIVSTETIGTPLQIGVLAEAHAQGAGLRGTVRPPDIDLVASVAFARNVWVEAAPIGLAVEYLTGRQQKPWYLMDVAAHWAPGGEHGALLLGGGAWFILSPQYREFTEATVIPHLEAGASLIVGGGFTILGTAGVQVIAGKETKAFPWLQLAAGWTF